MNEWQQGIYGEVVENDCYKLRELKFVPDIAFDIGGNIGTFTRFARELWPQCLVVSVEPHEQNIETFIEKTPIDHNIILYKKALGIGNLWHGLGTLNGAGEVYVSSGLGFFEKEMSETPQRVEKSHVGTVTIDEIYSSHYVEGMKSLIKIDCEGAEASVWGHKPSMDTLKKIDHICIELHYYSLVGGKMYDEMVAATNNALKEFEMTHDCQLIDNYFFATKKGMA